VRVLRAIPDGALAALFILTVSGTTAAQNTPAPPRSAIAPMAATALTRPPVIDGSLDDEAWAGPPLPTGEWKSYNPLYGDTIPQHTTVWAAYDKDALYFAFRCDDPDPSGIKTSITRRDNIWSDDWIGLSLDALGTGQTSYHLMVNPSGIQLDMVNTISGNEDTSPDWVWESAGRITDRGYVVEIKLPLQTIRFKGGPQVRMGILFWRRISRSGVSVAWPALEAGKWVFETHAPLVFKDLAAVPTRELIPSATYSRNEDRATPSRWDLDATGDLGLSAKWGLTSTVTLDATVNPDFSQVESDAFQVEVNQRYPVFFSEKRPFFMEGAGLFNLAGNAQGDASMLYAVYTRNIVDPIFGAKVTGTAGRVTFGSLTAIDQAPGRTEADADPLHGEEQLFQIGRAQIGLKHGSYAGAIATYTELAGRRNGVAGADVNYKINDAQRATAFVLGSNTTNDLESDDPNPSGVGLQANYYFEKNRGTIAAQVEHYDRGFVMDTAFLNRVGFTSGWIFSDLNFYPDKNRYPWIRKVEFFNFLQGGRDRINDGNEYTDVAGARLNFTRQGFFRVDQGFGYEAWRGRRFKQGRTRLFGQVQMFRWLRTYGNASWGPATYYDEVDPFQGKSSEGTLGVTLQPSGRFTQDLEGTHIAFDRESTGERVYTVNILNTRTTYQFTKELAIRGIVRYDSLETRVLTDFLGSYELRPGTVVYAGYGSLYQKRAYHDPDWIDGQGDYLTTRRGLFFKASYLYRF
jgi:Domain of unknown function (DUF5916)/Carbohydrate family 9 binding domain-like